MNSRIVKGICMLLLPVLILAGTGCEVLQYPFPSEKQIMNEIQPPETDASGETVSNTEEKPEDPETAMDPGEDPEEPETASGTDGESEEPETASGMDGESKEPETASGTDEESEDPGKAAVNAWEDSDTADTEEAPEDFCKDTRNIYEKDFSSLFEILKADYPYLSYIEEKNGIDAEEVYRTYLQKMKNCQNDQAFLYEVAFFLSEFQNAGHLYALTSEMYESYLEACTDEEHADFLKPWREILEDASGSELYRKTAEAFQSGSDASAETEIDLPKAKASYLSDIQAIYVKYPTFRHEISERDGSLLTDMMAAHPEAKNVIIDIRGNSGGDSSFWTDCIVKPLGGYYEFTTRIYFRDTGLVRRFHPVENALRTETLTPEELPEIADLCGLEMYSDTKDVLSDGSVPEDPELKKWILTDEAVYSSSEMFVDFCRQTGWAVIVGRKTHGDGQGGQPVLVKLENTGLLVSFGVFVSVNDKGQPSALFGTSPDVPLVKNEDALNKCKELIRESECPD